MGNWFGNKVTQELGKRGLKATYFQSNDNGQLITIYPYYKNTTIEGKVVDEIAIIDINRSDELYGFWDKVDPILMTLKGYYSIVAINESIFLPAVDCKIQETLHTSCILKEGQKEDNFNMDKKEDRERFGLTLTQLMNKRLQSYENPIID